MYVCVYMCTGKSYIINSLILYILFITRVRLLPWVLINYLIVNTTFGTLFQRND